jgi:hypothetical protein
MTGATFPAHAVEWTTREPRYYQSSRNAKRGFCDQCGSWISWKWLEVKISLTAGSFDHPEFIEPKWHVFTESRVPWIRLGDGLPEFERHPPEIESQDQQL